ncbi:hypothetical protein RFI_05205 [Reticulomyxa filosa]|uniref:Kelch motif family protein n=1 Tax=Reticulomyxa filosa TaxID=46433 RepID=X6P2X7_RETFI|nr:hypothetical protein RFI_05205 [Reticulomyxa filosa]|eukprot:ETO31912.1 hypothetical protein RFI_05205 [Reticulomyxa filosa]
MSPCEDYPFFQKFKFLHFNFLKKMNNLIFYFYCINAQLLSLIYFFQNGLVKPFFKKIKSFKKFSNINSMGNKTTSHTSTTFQNLKEVPTTLYHPQCVLHKHEILICGSDSNKTLKLEDNNNRNKVTLLSFGSDWEGNNRHTLVMKYISVWNSDNDNEMKSNNYNKWVPFTDDNNNPIDIGREYENYIGVRTVIGGRNNNLLFITYTKNNISVFNLNTFQFIKHDTLPISGYIQEHCFISNSENGQGQEVTKTNKQNDQMLLFYKKIGLSIEYDEDNNTFQFHQLPVCDDIAPLSAYAYVRINDAILFFGGAGKVYSKSVYQYSTQDNTWIKFKHTLPIPLCYCFGILNENRLMCISLEDLIIKIIQYQLT